MGDPQFDLFYQDFNILPEKGVGPSTTTPEDGTALLWVMVGQDGNLKKVVHTTSPSPEAVQVGLVDFGSRKALEAYYTE